jgi:hypothetical protein
MLLLHHQKKVRKNHQPETKEEHRDIVLLYEKTAASTALRLSYQLLFAKKFIISFFMHEKRIAKNTVKNIKYYAL